ncbi:hypothetical protein V1512DRAFT_268379 [Lipomyces arxii]|uniref:uncharacterized protein n=1 Tax=Lipomyces arxii TaxID=56418 RepID=UPI0034CE438A
MHSTSRTVLGQVSPNLTTLEPRQKQPAKAKWLSMISPFPLLPPPAAQIPGSSPPKSSSALEQLDHSSLTYFSELLLRDGPTTPTTDDSSNDEHDDVVSDHVAYGLNFVDDYFAPPPKRTHHALARASPRQPGAVCALCQANSDLVACVCCRTSLCSTCYGPRLSRFKFPRQPKNGLSLPMSPPAALRKKDLCQRCIRDCAGPRKRPGCRVREQQARKTSAASTASQRAHHRRLTQLSITAINAAATEAQHSWTAKVMKFVWNVTSFSWLTSLTVTNLDVRDRAAIEHVQDERRIVRRARSCM